MRPTDIIEKLELAKDCLQNGHINEGIEIIDFLIAKLKFQQDPASDYIDNLLDNIK